MSAPFTAQGTLVLSGAPGLPAEPLPFGLASQYTSKANFEYLFAAAAGTQVIDFGTMPAEGAKLVLVVYEDVDNESETIDVTINGADKAIELSAGGFIFVGSPVPSVGITSISIAHSSAGKVRVWVLG